MKTATIAIIGGGAAGFFGALNIAEMLPEARIVLFEKTSKLLSKVRVSGGGRCNVTHHCFENHVLIGNYPRGNKKIGSVFSQFSVEDIINWFGKRGVKLKTEPDGRMFPVTDNSQTIVDCFLNEAIDKAIEIRTGVAVEHLLAQNNKWLVVTNNTELLADYVLITTGGSPKQDGYNFITELGIATNSPLPSLFTFNIPASPFKGLEGIAHDVSIKTSAGKMITSGPLLITHWGISGPAVLKLSAWLAPDLAALNYHFSAFINWANDKSLEEIQLLLTQFAQANKAKQISTNPVLDFSKRLWLRFTEMANIHPDKKYADFSNKELNKLSEILFRCEVQVKGKTTFKEEFVTCGGVALGEIDMNTMQSKNHKGLYFAGEVLDIDAVTGGFNFQAAWSTSYVAAKDISKNSKS